MRVEHTLDSIHARVRQQKLLQLFTAFTRLLLAIGFIPPSITKILHQPFTVLPDSHPVGHYFNALYQTGFYYEFLGWGQLIAALLLLIPRTAHLGALMFFPIIVNIAVLTSAVGFKGTWLVTILMALASLYLVAWDYDRWKTVLFGSRRDKPVFLKLEFVLVPAFFAFGGVALAGLVYYLSVANANRQPALLFTVLPAIGMIFGFLMALHHRFMKVGPLERSGESL